MTVNELIDVVRTDYGFIDKTSAQALVGINAAYWDVCARHNWPFLNTSTSINTVASTAALTLPSDFHSVKSVTIPASRIKLEPEEMDWLLLRYYDLTIEGRPEYYYFDGDVLKLYPEPDGVYSVFMQYKKWPAALAAGGAENTVVIPPRHHEVLCLGGAYRMMEKDDDRFDNTKALYEERITFMNADLGMKQMDRPKRIYMMGDEEWLDPVGF